MSRRRVVFPQGLAGPAVAVLIAAGCAAAPTTLAAQGTASVQVQATVLAPPSYLAATPAATTGAGLGLRLVGSPNCAVTASVDGTTLPIGTCAPVGLLTAAAQQALGRAAKGGRTVVVTMTIDAGT
jgi:hypothetical protein